MDTERFFINSDGFRLQGFRYFDSGKDNSNRPAVVLFQGFTGMAEMLPRIFAGELVRRGYDVLAANYRGWGESEGPARRAVINEMARDVRALARLASARNPQGVVVGGWGLGAGLVVDGCWDLGMPLVLMNGVYDGRGFQLEHRTTSEMSKFEAQVGEGAAASAMGHTDLVIDPFDAYPMGPASHEYVEQTLQEKAEYDSSSISMSFADSLLNWYPMGLAEKARGHALVIHSKKNDIHAIAGAETLSTRWAGTVETLWLDEVGHTEWVEPGNATLQVVVDRVAEFARSSDPGLAL